MCSKKKWAAEHAENNLLSKLSSKSSKSGEKTFVIERIVSRSALSSSLPDNIIYNIRLFQWPHWQLRRDLNKPPASSHAPSTQHCSQRISTSKSVTFKGQSVAGASSIWQRPGKVKARSRKSNTDEQHVAETRTVPTGLPAVPFWNCGIGD